MVVVVAPPLKSGEGASPAAMPQLPFAAALGPAIEAASPRVKEHFLQPPGTRRYRGTMHRVWRRSGWRGRVVASFLGKIRWLDTLSAHTGTDVPFELENTVTPLPDGRAAMTWSRTYHFPEGTRRRITSFTREARKREEILGFCARPGGGARRRHFSGQCRKHLAGFRARHPYDGDRARCTA